MIFQTVFFIFIFSHCIFQSSSGVPCLSGYRNDSTWKINSQTLEMISQVESFPWLDKQRTPEEAGGYSVWNIVLQLTTIKMRTTVKKITHKILQDCKQIKTMQLTRINQNPKYTIYWRNNGHWNWQCICKLQSSRYI